MALRPVKYISFDEKRGSLYAAGIRSLLIPVGFIVSLNSILGKIVSPQSAQVLIYKIGQSIGEGYAKTIKEIIKKEKIELSQETLLKEAYNSISMQAGWGKFEILECDLEKKNIEVKITNSVSSEFLKESQYNLEKGLLAGVYKKITGSEIYFQIINKGKNFVILKSLKEIPEEILIKEKMALVGKKELEEKIIERTRELQEKVEELERFRRLTVGRELKMMELKKEIAELKKAKG